MHLLLTDWLYIVVGMLAGLLSGLLGVGGGVVTVPGFLWLFENQGFPSNIIMHMAAGSSLAAMVVTASFSLYAHYRRGANFGSVLYLMIPGLVIGTAGGALLAHFIHSEILRLGFGVLVISVSLKDFFATKDQDMSPKNYFGPIGAAMGAFVMGMVSGLLGVGGGTLMVPFLQYCGITMRNAVSISVASGLVIAVTGTISFILTGFHQTNLPPDSLGYLYLPACIGAALGSPIFTFIGTSLHHRLPVWMLKKVFSVFLIFVGFRVIF